MRRVQGKALKMPLSFLCRPGKVMFIQTNPHQISNHSLSNVLISSQQEKCYPLLSGTRAGKGSFSSLLLPLKDSHKLPAIHNRLPFDPFFSVRVDSFLNNHHKQSGKYLTRQEILWLCWQLAHIYLFWPFRPLIPLLILPHFEALFRACLPFFSILTCHTI